MARVAARPTAVVLAIAACAPGWVRAEAATGASGCELRAYDSSSALVSAESSHASLSRTLPPDVARAIDGSEDSDALTWVAACPAGSLPKSLSMDSLRPGGEPLDGLRSVALAPRPCPPDIAKLPGKSVECASTGPIRASVDLVDRAYPAVVGGSVCAEVGGRLVVTAEDGARTVLLVGGPRSRTEPAAPERYRARLRFHVIRASAGGTPAIGGNDAGAETVARTEARTAGLLWGQCGVHFGPDAELAVEVVDPPPRYLIAVGCDVGLPASGGKVAFTVGGKRFHVETHPGDPPVVVAHAVARALVDAGFEATVSPNARIQPGALRTADVLVRSHAKGSALLDVTAISGEPLSSDRTLGVCLGNVTTTDGLTHFDDLDAVAGTLEERALVKAYDDGDPTTIDVFVVPSFGKTGRIGESFIDMDGSGIQNVVIVDRAGIRAGSRSYALSHELGHVLLDLPGHPDDFGVDRPWDLMDADAADASIFGPRHLSFEDCERAVRQSGPGSAASLLVPWPFREQKARVAPLVKAPMLTR